MSFYNASLVRFPIFPLGKISNLLLKKYFFCNCTGDLFYFYWIDIWRQFLEINLVFFKRLKEYLIPWKLFISINNLTEQYCVWNNSKNYLFCTYCGDKLSKYLYLSLVCLCPMCKNLYLSLQIQKSMFNHLYLKKVNISNPAWLDIPTMGSQILQWLYF